MVEFQIVDLAVAGSNPVIHPNPLIRTQIASVAHLDRVTDFESVGSPFEPGRTHSRIDNRQRFQNE